MVKRTNKKVKVDPIHGTIFLIITAAVLIVILIYRLLKKRKTQPEDFGDFLNMTKEDKTKSNQKKSDKKNSNWVKKSRESFTQTQSAQSAQSVNNSNNKNVNNYRKTSDAASSQTKQSITAKTAKEKNKTKHIPYEDNKDLSSISTIIKYKKGNNLKLYLNEEEKDTFIALMGLVNDFAEREVQRVFDCSLYSVEYLFDTKFKCENKITNFDKAFNDLLANEISKVKYLKEFQNVLNLYNDSIQKNFTVGKSTLFQLVILCLQLEEINHALFFLYEMDKLDYNIPKTIIENLMSLRITGDAIRSKIKEQSKKAILSNANISRKKLDRSLILPNSDSYIQSPEYFYFKFMKEAFRGMNILNMLNTLKIESEPFLQNKKKKVEVESEQQEKTNVKDPSVQSKQSENNQNDIINTQLKTNSIPIDQNKKEESFHFVSNEKNVNNQPKGINLNDIKEYIPKKFKLVHKESIDSRII